MSLNKSQSGAFKELAPFDEGFAVTDTYQDGHIFDVRLLDKSLIYVKNSNASLVLYYTILGSLDKENWRTEVAEQTLQALASAVHEVTTPWAYLKVKSKIAPWGPLTSCWAHTTVGDTWIDETTDAADAGGGDIKIAPQGNSPGSRKDFIYYGCAAKFGKIKITIDYRRDYPTVGTIGWEYWDGDSWERFIPTTDETNGNRVQGVELEVIFDQPVDWATKQVNTDPTALYYIRFGGYANAQANATAAQVWVLVEEGEITAHMIGKRE